MKKITIVLITSVIGAILLLSWFALIDVNEVLKNISNVNIPLLLVAIIIYVFSFFIRSVRWNIILRSIKKMGIWRTFVLYMTGNYINFLVPVRAGELAKSLFIKKMDKIPIATTFPSIIFDKILDLTPVFAIIMIVPLIEYPLSEMLWTVLLIVLVVTLVLFSLFYLGIKNQKALVRLFKTSFFWLPTAIKGRAFDFFHHGVYGLSIAKQKPRNMALILALTLLAVISDTLYMTFVFRAFDVQISILIVFIGYTLFNLSYVLPTPPAQIGSAEMFLLLIFSGAFGVEKNLMSSVIVVVHAITGLYILLSGIISTTSLGIGVIDTLKKGSSE